MAAAGREMQAIRTEGGRRDREGVRQRRAEALAGGRLPELGLPILCEDVAAPCQDVLAVGAESYRPNRLAVIEGNDRRFSSNRLPQPGAVLIRSQDESAIGAKRHTGDSALMPEGRTERLSRGGIPQLGRVV